MGKVGEVFDMLLGKGPSDTKADLTRAAIEAMYCENAMWQTWRLHDPVTAVEFARMRNIVRAAKARQDELRKTNPKAVVPEAKWPKFPAYVPKDIPEGQSPTRIAKELSPSLASCVYDAIANHVGKLYLKSRFQYLSFSDRIPVSDKLRIRFREVAIRVLRDDRNPEWFKLSIKLFKEPKDHRLVIPIFTRGKSPHTLRWLAECADNNEHPSGGMISARRKKGKLVWQISLTRERYEGERDSVREPVSGRVLDIEAPLDQAEFLKCSIDFPNGRPWSFVIEGHDMLNKKTTADMRRRRKGRNYSQSPDNAAHGHGRNNVLRSKQPSDERFENCVDNWIENRTKSIVASAVEKRCESIRMENLVERDPKTLILGSFPYFKFQLRLKQKATEAGLKYGEWPRSGLKAALAS